MFNVRVSFMSLVLMSMLLLLLSPTVAAQSGDAHAGQPPIGQPLIREGDFALKLAPALSVGTPRDEVEAENQLSAAGITPRNGWIADYPVTPDIIDELYTAVHDAATSGKIPLSVDAALQRFNEVMSQTGMSVDTRAAETDDRAELPGPPRYPSPAVINNYYQTEGPPAVTYYAPPPDYSYLYGWVPLPFWSFGFWYPGFFILHDFHRTVFFDNRAVFVSNHFHDIRHHRHIRLDPNARIRGHNIANTRVIHSRGDSPVRASTRGQGIIREQRSPSVRGSSDVRSTVSRGSGSGNSNFRSNVRNDITAAQPAGRNASVSIPSREIRTTGITTRAAGVSGISGSGTRVGTSPPSGGRSFNSPRFVNSSGISGMTGRGGSMISQPSRGGSSGRMSFQGNSSMGGRGRR